MSASKLAYNATLSELVNIACTPWGETYRAVCPTWKSVARIQHELGLTLPEAFIDIASSATKYGGWFCSIGEDYDSFLHIIRMNAAFHFPKDSTPPLPKHLILFNHGHEGDCDCFDTTLADYTGALPVVYFQARSGIKKRWDSFELYIVDYVRDHAGQHHVTNLRRRAQTLLKEAGLL